MTELFKPITKVDKTKKKYHKNVFNKKGQIIGRRGGPRLTGPKRAPSGHAPPEDFFGFQISLKSPH